jgi:predicted amidohydrolase
MTVAQPPCVPGDVESNVEAHAAVIRASDPARVVVFPEMSLTGLEMTARSVDLADPRLKPVVDACAETGAIALAGAPVAEDGREYMAVLRFDGSDVSVAYRKMWLSPPEDERFVPGPEPVVLDVDGWRLGLAVCWDVMVPAHVEATAALGIDAYVVGSLSPVPGESRVERLRTIAAEHGVWVALATFAGPAGDYPQTSGGSAVWAPGGDLVAQADANPGSAVTVELRR